MSDKTENKIDQKAVEKAELETKLDQVHRILNPLSKVFDTNFLVIMADIAAAINKLHQAKIEILTALDSLESGVDNGQTRATTNSNQ